MEQQNPYAAPSTTGEHPLLQPTSFETVTQGVRFANFIIDTVVVVVLSLGVGFAVGIAFGGTLEEEELGLAGNIAGILLQLLYFTVMEGATGRTVGKLVTGTKVVNAEGQPVGMGKALLRSLCRFIPFEPFSFLGSQARGWHDSLTKTWVIKAR